MHRALLLLLILILPSAMHACICAEIRTLKEDVLSYTFIARIQVQKTFLTEDSGFDGNIKVFFKRVNHEIKILELFKGDSIKTLVEYDVSSSCEIGLKEGEEWILFAQRHTVTESYFIAACNPSMPFMNARGEKNWKLQKRIKKEIRRSALSSKGAKRQSRKEGFISLLSTFAALPLCAFA